MLESPVVDSVEAGELEEAKIAGMDDSNGIVFASKVVER